MDCYISLMIDPRVTAIVERIASRGGRAIAVGGWVRDRLLGLTSKDLDIEVFGLGNQELEALLAEFGEVLTVGQAFGVMRLKGLDLDFSLPRRDSKVAPGHRGFSVQIDPGLDFAAAARRRDLTINSIGLDLRSGELLDPYGGQCDLNARRLRATDPGHFAEDPLRALRVAQFAARFEMQPEKALLDLCRGLDLTEVSPERIWNELRKLLLKGRKPSLGFEFLQRTELLRFFPELGCSARSASRPAMASRGGRLGTYLDGGGRGGCLDPPEWRGTRVRTVHHVGRALSRSWQAPDYGGRNRVKRTYSLSRA